MTTHFAPLPTAQQAERRYLSWLIGFTRRAGLDRDRLLDVAKDAAKVVMLPPLTVTEAAQALGIPGSTPAGKAQKLRRLERQGRLPRAHRSMVSWRYWLPEELAELIATRHEEFPARAYTRRTVSRRRSKLVVRS